MTSTIDATSFTSDGRTLAEILSSVPPVPPAVLATVAKTGFGQRHSSWAAYKWDNKYSYNIPQLVTALVLIQQSPAGKEWGVQLAAIPSNIRSPSDARYAAGCSLAMLTEIFAYVEWFFARSRVSEDAPGATVAWEDIMHTTGTQHPGIPFSCGAIKRMLYAAQELQSRLQLDPEIKTIRDSDKANEVSRKFAAMETRVASLEADNATLGSQLQQLTLKLQKVASQIDIRGRAPTVTCLMHLFAGYIDFGYTNCDAVASNSTDIDTGSTLMDIAHSNADSPTGTPPHQKSVHGVSLSPVVSAPRGMATNPAFRIAPHTDRLSDLGPDAQEWFLNRLNTRSVWIRATEPESHDNHISWSPFSGAVEVSRLTVAFSYGKYRFW